MDKLWADPPRLPHPIVWFGRLIACGERMLNHGRWRALKGGLLAVGLVAGVYVLTFVLLTACRLFLGVWLASLVSAVLVFYCLAGTTLIREVKGVFAALDVSTEQGRKQVARIVGRDTSQLTDNEIRKAALETLAENLSDGVIAPMFWLLLLGVPGMAAYKMINTLDSMIGYRTERYKRFGTAAARIDDAANYIPARLTALLMIAVAGKPELLKFVARNGKRHASPNSGYPEAALAGILNCRFGGLLLQRILRQAFHRRQRPPTDQKRPAESRHGKHPSRSYNARNINNVQGDCCVKQNIIRAGRNG